MSEAFCSCAFATSASRKSTIVLRPAAISVTNVLKTSLLISDFSDSTPRALVYSI